MSSRPKGEILLLYAQAKISRCVGNDIPLEMTYSYAIEDVTGEFTPQIGALVLYESAVKQFLPLALLLKRSVSALFRIESGVSFSLAIVAPRDIVTPVKLSAEGR